MVAYLGYGRARARARVRVRAFGQHGGVLDGVPHEEGLAVAGGEGGHL